MRPIRLSVLSAPAYRHWGTLFSLAIHIRSITILPLTTFAQSAEPAAWPLLITTRFMEEPGQPEVKGLATSGPPELPEFLLASAKPLSFVRGPVPPIAPSTQPNHKTTVNQF